ncbi:DUF6807 family protein [Streptosporangium sp. NPDC023615]|uniref:DUF6807 family protein n=1 Tax=Streptosporangium sp. NPDC023615 TaxID=3154794 RepID=UPI00341CC0E7
MSASPRPYLHPVRTLAGVTVTDAAPDSHTHQFGISVAFPELDGCNFWGGRTFIAGHGPAWLDNHGIQRHRRWTRRTGAGYGGILWRGPAVTGVARVLGPAGADLHHVHGHTADRVAVTGTDHDGRPWTMIFTPGDEVTARDRWFVRARDYPGVCSSLTWDEPFTLAPGESVQRHVIAVVADGVLPPASAAGLTGAARATT